jgi:hypothetical protein
MSSDMDEKKLKLVDTLIRKAKKENSSIWQGKSGSTYVFKHLEQSDEKKRMPIVQVYKDRQYYTGLFRTKEPTEFSGDVKYPDGKKYLIFQVAGKEKMQVFQKSAIK